MPLTPSVVEELRRVVGRESMIDSANDLRIFERDGSIEGAVPDAVVLASTTDQVAGGMKGAAPHPVPGVPRRAGTGLSGGAGANPGGGALPGPRPRPVPQVDPPGVTGVWGARGGR